MSYSTQIPICIIFALRGKIACRRGGASHEIKGAGIPDFTSNDNTCTGKAGRVAKSSIEAMESALPNPTLRMLYSVAKALEVRIQDLIEYEDGDE